MLLWLVTKHQYDALYSNFTMELSVLVQNGAASDLLLCHLSPHYVSARLFAYLSLRAPHWCTVDFIERFILLF